MILEAFNISLVSRALNTIDSSLEFKDQARLSIHIYAEELRTLANAIINELGKSNPDLESLFNVADKTSFNIRHHGTHLHNMTDEMEKKGRRVLPGSKLGNYLFSELKDIPMLIRTANRVQAEYRERMNTHERFGFLLPDDRAFERRFILPFQYDLSPVMETAQVPRRRLGERLSQLRGHFTGLGHRAAHALRIVSIPRRSADLHRPV